MSIKQQVEIVKESLKEYPNVKVVAAVKYFDIDKTKEIVEAGITDIGENRKDSFLAKYEALKDYNITWHYFGVIKIPPKLNSSFIDAIDYLHSLDSIDLANAINKTRKRKEPLKCFVQVNVSDNSNKSGLDESKVIPFIKSLEKYKKIEVVGLMTVAKYTYDDDLLISYYEIMQELQKEIQSLNLSYAPCTELSMGMSSDYKLAVQHGATIVRLGTIFTK
ncbi:MAG: YggS family pyridoxal phosphate-dependent enzyme [Bacilli bacterium]|nr:YggS family pyridoxal phosphate-dependent enzyme [Bacilli bacterium]MDD7315468.1 YggS family pyridoxal phosphate-dependent enzyme [Bacilli bacterium]MDY4051868.1 YggS family pyridoxal phosphate-dependent enzyme [Bacilli bacterium]